VSKPDGAYEQENPLEAIRALVEENGLALETLDSDVLTLDDIVWRSPARQVVDPTDIIKRLAEEADKVANGKALEPPRAVVHRRTTTARTVVKTPAKTPAKTAGPTASPTSGTADRQPSRHREPVIARPGIRSDGDTKDIEAMILQRVLDDLAAKGLTDAEGRPQISKGDLRLLVRAHIKKWTEQQNASSTEDALQAQGIMRKTTP
jgi:hypothetical protein